MPDMPIRDPGAATLAQTGSAASERQDAQAPAAGALTATSKATVWAELDALKAKIGKVSSDSTAMIRADRDNDEPHR